MSHLTLNSKINHNYPELIEARKPVRRRHKSIITKWDGVRSRGFRHP